MTHIQLSNPGNSRNQIGRMLASDSRFVAFANGKFIVLFLILHLFKLKLLDYLVSASDFTFLHLFFH